APYAGSIRIRQRAFLGRESICLHRLHNWRASTVWPCPWRCLLSVSLPMSLLGNSSVQPFQIAHRRRSNIYEQVNRRDRAVTLLGDGKFQYVLAIDQLGSDFCPLAWIV